MQGCFNSMEYHKLVVSYNFAYYRELRELSEHEHESRKILFEGLRSGHNKKASKVHVTESIVITDD
jgi:hypothetical protein